MVGKKIDRARRWLHEPGCGQVHGNYGLRPGVQGRGPGATKDGGRLEVEDEQGGVELERREEGTVTWDLAPSRKTKEWSPGAIDGHGGICA
jgi:hypothetical protein